MKIVKVFLILVIVVNTALKAQLPPIDVPEEFRIPAEKDDEEKVFVKVEDEAKFPGGDTAWMNFLMKNINTENFVNNIKLKRKEKFIQETVVVKFIVLRDGTLSEIVVENKVNPFFAKEALRVIKKSPRWIPAYQNGRKVNAYKRQPITFRVDK
jgi:periplasmic protein TonB